MSDAVNHPDHYNAHPANIECIDVVEHMTFNLGNAVKYLWRAGLKGAPIEDLRKAIWYIDREISRTTGSPVSPTPETVGMWHAQARAEIEKLQAENEKLRTMNDNQARTIRDLHERIADLEAGEQISLRIAERDAARTERDRARQGLADFQVLVDEVQEQVGSEELKDIPKMFRHLRGQVDTLRTRLAEHRSEWSAEADRQLDLRDGTTSPMRRARFEAVAGAYRAVASAIDGLLLPQE